VTRVVNLGGEGEVPGAVNVNLFLQESMFDPHFDQRVDAALILRRSAHDTGLADSSADTVLAYNFPIQFDEFITNVSGERAHISVLAAEVVRVLRSGGSVEFHCSSCDRESLATAFRHVRLVDVHVRTEVVLGRKP
jgi:hypothetical protein